MRRLLTLTFAGLLLANFPVWGQTESTLYFMNSIPQVVDANPAIMPRYKISVGLPVISSMSAVYANNGFTYNDIVTKVDGVPKINLSTWTQNLADQNYISMAGAVDLLRVGVRINPKMYLMVSSTVKGYNRTMLPKGLASLFVDGTAPLVGSYTNTSPQVQGMGYLSTDLGLAYKASEKLTIGGRIKYLKGLANVSTEHSTLIVQVGNDYSITATGDALVNTSGVHSYNNDNDVSIGDFFTGNVGWGLDIGATYKFMDKLTLGFSLNDIGYINWTNDTYAYTLNPATAKYTFSGFDVNQLVAGNHNYLSQQLDSLEKRFEMKETKISSYTTNLPAKFYFSANYELIPNLSVGALYFGENYKDRFTSGLTAAVNKNFGKWVSTSLTYTVSNRSYNNLGLGVSFNLTPIQLYFVGDNLLLAPVSLVKDSNVNSFVNSAQLLTLRAGLNIVIGWDKGNEKKAKKAEDDSHNPKENTSNAKVKNTHGGAPAKKKSNKKVKPTYGRSPSKKK